MVVYESFGSVVESVLLEPLKVLHKVDEQYGSKLMILEEPNTRDAQLVPAESLLFGFHLCPVFSSRIRGRHSDARSFDGSRAVYKQWCVNHYAEEHTAHFFGDVKNRDLFE
ncbi:hypothetical protein BCR44DRAFT_1430579 [Catenaria anguillulae PL171]|uniref:Uncharacterized protein n=1 Tax=Catenaria anguillulae PL171 TaxID=765915 RepID=A0A1Y2HWV5_9FUNG|nr:hypothetical protein BCR44DRAFT_1430579 [Catenaria anguillulae PL171]